MIIVDGNIRGMHRGYLWCLCQVKPRSKALPLADCSLSLTTAWVQLTAGACEKVVSDLSGGFCWLLQYP